MAKRTRITTKQVCEWLVANTFFSGCELRTIEDKKALHIRFYTEDGTIYNVPIGTIGRLRQEMQGAIDNATDSLWKWRSE